MKKNNIIFTLVLIIVICVVLFVVFSGKAAKIKTALTEEEQLTSAKQIEKNFYQDISNAKKGKYKKYLYCDKTDCTKIDKFNIKNVRYVETLLNGNNVFQINYTWSCKDNKDCLYNDQYIQKDVSPYYEVDKNNEIINNLGNIFEHDFNIIKSNFDDAVGLIKSGENVKFLPYSGIDTLNIKTIDYIKTLDNSNFVYKVSYDYTCSDKNSCLNSDYSYYEVSSTFEVLKDLGKKI